MNCNAYFIHTEKLEKTSYDLFSWGSRYVVNLHNIPTHRVYIMYIVIYNVPQSWCSIIYYSRRYSLYLYSYLLLLTQHSGTQVICEEEIFKKCWRFSKRRHRRTYVLHNIHVYYYSTGNYIRLRARRDG